LKKTTLAVAVSVLAVLMVLPIVRSVNLSAVKPVTVDRTLRADGWPLPPPIPPSHSFSRENPLFSQAGWATPSGLRIPYRHAGASKTLFLIQLRMC